jgi:transcriptional regulator with PAS, ATPase and Fis domain
LRAIQERSVRPVGSSEQVSIDVRIVAATNRNLQREVDEGRFRADLFYRLDVVRIAVPPLRNRLEDVDVLIEHFLQRFGQWLSLVECDVAGDCGRSLADQFCYAAQQLATFHRRCEAPALECLARRSERAL